MKAKIQRNKIHQRKRKLFDAAGNPTGDEIDILELGIEFTEYPDLPTYGLTVDLTGITTKAELREAIKTELLALVGSVEIQIQKDDIIRDHFDDWGWSDREFETDNL